MAASEVAIGAVELNSAAALPVLPPPAPSLARIVARCVVAGDPTAV